MKKAIIPTIMALAIILGVMATEKDSFTTLFPVGDGIVQEWDGYPAAKSHFTLVDDRVFNGDTDYIYTDTEGKVEDFKIEFKDTIENIDNIRIVVSAKSVDPDSKSSAVLNLGIKIDGVRYSAATNNTYIDTGYMSATQQWNINPTTGNAWQPDELEGVQISIESIKLKHPSTSVRLSQAFVLVQHS